MNIIEKGSNQIINHFFSNGMLIRKQDYDLVHTEILDTLAEVVAAIVPEERGIGYEEGKEEPTTQDEFLADLYETKADAWFAGFDKCRAEVLKRYQEIIDKK